MDDTQIIDVFNFAVGALLHDEDFAGVSPSVPMVSALTDIFARSVTQTFRCPGQDMYDHAWPADWREALKDRWFPTWMKERWPVRYEHVSVKALYPYLKLPDEPVSWNVNVRVG